jgi:leucyl-tRNA synthetase
VFLSGNIESELESFTAVEWNSMSESQRSNVLLNFRLAYLSEAWVNWCPALGTVLANDEVIDGNSERGGYPVERKRMKQWSLRMTAYADRLLKGLDAIDWPDSIKDAQRNWIGRSEGSTIRFRVADSSGKPSDDSIEVFTTRPDTVFGVSFVTLAPEHDLVERITLPAYRDAVADYVKAATNKTERERQSDVKKVSGQFTGAYVLHPFTGESVPVWIGEYVLAGYGTGAVMAVPAHDQRDFLFARHFGIPVKKVIEGGSSEEEAYTEKYGNMINSDFLNGLDVKEAIPAAIREIEKKDIGKGRVNFRLRDAAFGRQRYWGEPIPVFYKDGVPCVLDESELPLVLPDVDKFQPTDSGEPPLARAVNWKYKGKYEYETTTMPGWAGSSWYFLRYMDARNDKAFVSNEALVRWNQVDFYLGGAEHATGHLLYVRFWTKFLFDRGFISVDEPAKKLVNQGMIQGVSAFVFRINGTNRFVSAGLRHDYETTPLHVDVSIAPNHVLDIERFKAWREDFQDAEFLLEEDVYKCGAEVEKMSKSKYNVVNPDDIIEEYGADTLRLYEMFLGPLEQSKPWSTQGINGVFNFLRRFWRMFRVEEGVCTLSDTLPTAAELKILHKTIKKVEEDVERHSFNTTVSAFMICINELTELKCDKRAVLEPLVVLLSPYAPHIAEELWHLLGHTESVTEAQFPQWKQDYLVEQEFEYPVSINGKVRFKLNLSLQLSKEDIEKQVLESSETGRYLTQPPKKIVVVPGRIVNIVV